MNNLKSEELEDKTEARNKIKENVLYYFLLSFGFGLLFMVTFYDFDENFNGIFYLPFVIGLFAFTIAALKKMSIPIKKSSIILIIAALLLGISSVTTMNLFVIAFNTLGIQILYGLFLTKHFYQDRNWEILQYLAHFLKLGIYSIGNMFLPFNHFVSRYKVKNQKLEQYKPVLRGFLFGILFLSIIVPLLSSADLVFGTIVRDVTSYICNPFQGEWYVYVIFTIVGTLLFYGLLNTISKQQEKTIEVIKEKREPISAITMTWLIAGIYILFCGIQIIYLFGGRVLELPEGITYAEYAHQGFFQLLFVALINIGMVLLLLDKVTNHKYLRMSLTVISFCTFIMITSAVYRMVLYVSVYHLSFLRILVLWFLALLTIIMAGVVYYIYHKDFWINRFLFFVTLIFYLFFAFIRPDYLVANYNITHMEEISSSDMYYLTYLSLDAVPVLSGIREEQIDQDESKDILRDYYNRIYNSNKKGIRNFNLSRYEAYQIVEKEMIKR
ncbi:MAG: DUF4173 domain-containing protein [Clostridiales bacterium]|nr:DUF4173 domain-containing protein [Clostridiales bacterium]